MAAGGRLLSVALAGVLACLPKPALAQAISEQLEGTLGSQPVSAGFGLMGRQLSGSLRFSASEEINLEGELRTKPLSQGLTSCELEPLRNGPKKKHLLGKLTGICELDELNGAATLSFEGYWREPGRSDERVVLTSRRVVAAQLWQRYGALVPAPVAPAGQQPPLNCASTPAIDAAARDSAKRVFVLHSLHFHCLEPPYGLEWSSYAAALSVIDESGDVPVWLGTTPVPHGVAEAHDVVSWEAYLSSFWLTPSTLGLVTSVGGTISGSGVATDATESFFAVDGSGAPRHLLSVPGDSFGKSNIENYGGDSVGLYATQPTATKPARVLVSTHAWATIDGIDQDGSGTDELYRFDPQRTALQKLPKGALAPPGLLPIGPVSPRVLSDIPTLARRL